MDINEAAAALNGNEYGEEGSKELFAKMKDAGLVAVFGASDDLMEFRGAIYEEFGCYGGGGPAYITPKGLFDHGDEGPCCEHFEAARAKCATITPIWDGSGYSWTYETSITHATFEIVETDGEIPEKYCRGIVFALSDVPA